MPKKIRELRAQLRKAGFIRDRTTGSHSIWYHQSLPTPVNLSGKDGDDAQHYQEKDVREAIAALRGRK